MQANISSLEEQTKSNSENSSIGKSPDADKDSIKPTTPTNLTLTNSLDNLLQSPKINFDASSDIGGSGVNHYEVQIYKSSDNSAVSGWTAIQSGDRLNTTSLNLSYGTNYYFGVRAVDNAGNVSDLIYSSVWTTTTQGVLSFESTQMAIFTEGMSDARIRVNLSSVRDVDTAFNYLISGMVNAADFTTNTLSGIAIIPAGQSFVDIVSSVQDDNVVEPIEKFNIQISLPADSVHSISGANNATGLILDNDPDSDVMVVSGANHNCAKNVTGQVKCWGRNNWGQLGIGDTADRGDNANEMGVSLPFVDLGTGVLVKKLSSSNGADNTCALTTTGKVKCWGRGNNWNEPGYMGYGHSNNIGDQIADMGNNLPYINLGTGFVARDLVTSSFNSCVIGSDFRAKCWGVGFHGANGNASNARIGANLSEMGDNLSYMNFGTSLRVLKIAMGAFHRCALFDNLKVKCWGWDTAGELGYETSVTRGDDANEMGDNLPFVNLGTNVEIVDIAAATGGYFESGNVHHTCALTSEGKVKCWGAGASGQLGYGNTSSRGSTVGSMGDNLPYVNLGTGRYAKRIFASHHSTCAILDNDRLKCWGNGGSGQLGNDSTSNLAYSGTTVGDNLPYVLLGAAQKVLSVSGSFTEWGNGHKCAVLDGFNIKCWGKNTYGELGAENTNTLGDNTGEMSLLNVLSIF